MRLLALSLVVLLCISVSQAAVGYVSIYDFNSLSPGPGNFLNGQSDTDVTWRTSETGNTNRLTVGGTGGGGNVYAQVAGVVSQERLSSSLNTTPGSLFTLDATDQYIVLSYQAYMDYTNHWLNGIWIDLDANNTMPNSEAEIAIQFGARSGTSTTTPYNRGFRVRGANAGAPDTYSGTNLDPNIWSATAANLQLVLYIDLLANGGDGYGDMAVANLDTGYVAQVITNAPLGLNTAGREALKNPANWTGWAIRNQGPGSSTVTVTLDNLKLEVIPEPATLTLLVLGGLACLRRRR